MNPIAKDILMHYGMPKRSGRYPWGSGEDPYQHSGDFLSRVEELKKQGITYTDGNGKVWTGDTAVAKTMGLTSAQFRTQKALAKNERRALEVATAKGLREKGYSLNEIAEKMGYNNDSSVRSLLNEKSEARMNQAKVTADILRKAVNEKGMIDVGVGVEQELGISRERMKEALYILELEGYNTFGGGVPQVTNPGKQTNIQVLCPPDTPYKINENGDKVSSAIYDFENVHTIDNYVSHDGGDSFDPVWIYPKSMDSKRLQVRYAEEGGEDKDGLVELRRGVDDLSLGESRYSQVRILVDDTKYIKGMAVYSDDMPDGIDVIFNTNKKLGISKSDVLKNISTDPDNPFGSLIKSGINDPTDPTSDKQGGQSYYLDKNGKKHLSLINKRADEGDWDDWKDKVPAQFLAKQNKSLMEKQLKLSIVDKQSELDEIMSLTNPTVKKTLLQSFADDCDSAAVHLQAAALPRQKYHVILPVPQMKDNEIYAPNYKSGEQVALVRYPHGGTFEIPILTVNNKMSIAKKLIGADANDAVCINSKVASRLSGADFDGDTVMVIPTGGKIKISSTPPLKALAGFDPKLEYGADSKKQIQTIDKKTGKTITVDEYYRGDKRIKVMNNTQNEMGRISNLITDMTLKGAKPDALAKAVRHSMVVIDAEKHKLDYKQSEIDNNIAGLRKKYQGHYTDDGKYHEGASTLISRSKSETQVLKRKGSPIIDKETGKVSYKEVYETYVDKSGKTQVRTQKSTKMAETSDAYTLVSKANTPQERVYASYANTMKSLANQARKEMGVTGKVAYVASAKKVYQAQVASLEAKLKIALRNAPKERQAQLMANTTFKAKKQANLDLTKNEQKKIKQQALTSARASVGAKKEKVKITSIEWEAIQAGAISEYKLTQILKNTDIDIVRQYATPKTTTALSASQKNRIAAMSNSGYTTSEIANALGISTSTVSNYT